MKQAGLVAVISIFIMFLAEILPYMEYYQVFEYMTQKMGLAYSENTAFFIIGFGLFLRLLSIFGLLFFFIRFYQIQLPLNKKK